MLAQKIGFELKEDVSELHLTRPQSMTIRFIKAWIRSIAFKIAGSTA